MTSAVQHGSNGSNGSCFMAIPKDLACSPAQQNPVGLCVLVVFGPCLIMGNTLFCCDCSEMCREPVDQAEDGFEKERNAASKKLFELTDLNGDGLITVDEFAVMGLNQTKVHAEKKLSLQDEQSIKDVFVKKFFNEIDSSFQPVPYGKYKDYILRSVNHMDPGDFQAPVSQVSIIIHYDFMMYIFDLMSSEV